MPSFLELVAHIGYPLAKLVSIARKRQWQFPWILYRDCFSHFGLEKPLVMTLLRAIARLAKVRLGELNPADNFQKDLKITPIDARWMELAEITAEEVGHPVDFTGVETVGDYFRRVAAIVKANES